jgi:hypothetical protein
MKQLKSLFGGVLMTYLFVAVLCSTSAYAAPSVTISSYTNSIELDYLGSVQWTISSDTKETGVNYAYKSDKSDAKGVVSPSTGLTSYAAVVVPKRGNCQIYFRVYAKGNNNVITYSPWYMISTAAYCSAYAKTSYSPSMNLYQVPVMKDAESGQLLYASASACTDKEIPFEIQELDYAYIAGDTVKDFVIGGCMNDGIVSFNCALDLGGIIPVTKLTKIAKLEKFAKFTEGLNKLKQGYVTTKFLGSIQKVSSAVKKMFVWNSKGTKATRTGAEVASGVSQGILREEIATTGKIFEKTELPKLGDHVLEKGMTSVNRVKGTGATNEMLETIITKNGNLEKTLRAGNSAKGVTWLEEGTSATGWKHIVDSHVTTGQFRSVGIPDSQVQQKIFETIKNPTKGTLNSKGGQGWCFFSNLVYGAKTYYIKAVVASNGYVVTSHPVSDLVKDYKCD